VNDPDFQQLLASVKEAGRIKRGEQKPARKFEVKAEDVKANRAASEGGSQQSAGGCGCAGSESRGQAGSFSGSLTAELPPSGHRRR
jgi:hypothetical protein